MADDDYGILELGGTRYLMDGDGRLVPLDPPEPPADEQPTPSQPDDE